MKSFMKVCGILALILLGAGLALTIAGLLLGGPEEIARGVERVTDGKLSVDLDVSSGSFGITAGGYSTDDLKKTLGDILDNKIYHLEDYGTQYDAEHSVASGDIARYNLKCGEVTALDMEAGGCDLRIEQSPDEDFWLEAENVSRLQAYAEGDTLYVRSTRSGTVSGETIKSTIITLYVPQEYFFDEIRLNLGIGFLSAEGLWTGEAEVQVGAGQIILQDFDCEDFQGEVGAGDLTIENGNLGACQCSVGVGNVFINGVINGDAQLTCAMGNIEAALSNEREDFNYQLECSMGNISLGGEDFSGLAKEHKIDNAADHTMRLECSMGNVTVDFE